MANEIIPVGKYKGQPLEILKQDPDCTEWLCNQDWFKERFSRIHTVIVNNFGQAIDTPEHNAMQTRALDIEWRKSLVRYYYLSTFKYWSGIYNDASLEFEFEGFDVKWNFCSPEKPNAETWKKHLLCELKPSVSDDYPAVLRQVKNNYAKLKGALYIYPTVVTDRYVGVGATIDQVKSIFRHSNVLFVLSDELNMEFADEDDDGIQFYIDQPGWLEDAAKVGI